QRGRLGLQPDPDRDGPGRRQGGSPATADQLTALAGHAHDLITALVVIRGQQISRHTDVARLRMRPLTRAAIERYVKADQPLDCVGSYKDEIDNPDEPRCLFQFILTDRRIRVDKKKFMADRPVIAVSPSMMA